MDAWDESRLAGGGADSSGDSSRDQVEVLADEFLFRRRNGEQPEIEEYTSRYPDLASEIRAVFPTLLLVEDLGKESLGLPVAGPEIGAPARDVAEGTSEGNPAPRAARLEQVGEYRILREIGRGGMGVVYEAEQESLGRRVALKLLPFHSLLGRRHLERFQQEARAAARLSHPHIVPIFGVGEHLGLHYFVMQYIPGQGLDAVIEELARMPRGGKAGVGKGIARGLSSSGRDHYYRNVARIARDAARALDHAHREGVLHRDVKPSNLILDPAGHIWLVDFGLAKSEDSDDLTHSGDFVGTLRYTAPERLKGWSDPRSDVYSLGLTLYELLALRPAFVESDRGRLLRKVASEEPPSLRRIVRSVPRDIETIILKAAAKEPAQRYPSAQAMADDLDRFLRDEPVEARRATPLGRLSRWCARNPVLAALGATVLVLLVLVAAVSSHKNVQLKRESDLGREKLRDSYLAQARAARLSGQPGQRFGSLQTLLDAAQIRPGPELCDEAAASLALDDVRLVKSWSKKPSQWVTFDDDVARYALPEANGEVVIRSTADDRELVRLPGPGHDVPFIDIGFHPDGRHAAVRYHKFNAYDRWTIWDLERREAVARLDDGIGTGGFDFDRRDGSFVATVRGNGLRAVEVPSGRVVSELRFRFAPGALSLHPGGELAAVAAAGDRERECHVIEQRSGRVLRTLLHEKRTWGVAWDPRGRFLAVGCDDFRVYLWDADTGALRWSQRGHQAQATSVAFHPTGSFLFSAGWDNQTIAWDTWTGHRLFTVPGGQAYPGKDGMRFGTRSRFEYQHFELASRPVEFVLHGHEKPDEKHPLSVALAPGGRLAASCGADGVRIWDLAGRAEVAHFPVSTVYSLEFAPDGGSLLASGRSGLLRWPIRSHVAGGRRRMVFGHPEPVVAVDDLWRHSSTGGGQVAFIHNRSRIHVRSLAGAGAGTAAAGKLELGTQLEPVPELAMVALSPDGCWVAGSSSQLEHVLIWDAISGQRVASVEAPYSSLGFDPRNRFLVAGAPQEYLFIRTGDWTVERRLPRASGLSFQAPLAFDPRGEVMVLAHSNSRLWLLEIESGRRLAELEASDPRELNGLALDLEGGFLAASSLSQRVYVWDLRAASRQLAACGLPWEVRCVGDGPGREGLQVEAVPRRSALGLARDVEDPRAPPLLRECRQALFLPSLRSYGEIDATLASPRFLVPEGVSWKYARGLSEPGEGLAWTTLEFDDRAWPAGPGGFGGSSSRDDETMTSLGDQRGVYSTLYLRHVFELDRADRVEKLLLALRFEDGFVAYLNGREVARRNAGEPGDRLPHDAVASRAMNTRLEFLSRIDAAPLLPGKNALAVQVLASQRSAYLFALPVLAAVHAADEAEDRRRTGAIARGPDGAPDLLLSAYAAGRVLERSGKLAEALSEYQRAGTMDPASPEPILRRAACLGALGEIEPCETLLRESLERGELIDDGGLWAEWSLVTFRDLRRPLTEALSTWPGGDKPTSRHGTDLRFVVAELASRGALRINCGGSACRSRDGTDWSEDRFYLGGVGLRGGTPDGASPVAGTELDPVYRDHRRFWGDREVRPGYRIPIPPGRYLVGLHFAETEAGKTGRRIFGALLERRTVLAGYEPLRAGFATAQVQSFEVEVTDGFLDLDFLAEEPNPILSGLSVERRP